MSDTELSQPASLARKPSRRIKRPSKCKMFCRGLESGAVIATSIIGFIIVLAGVACMISGPSCDCNRALDFYRSNFSDNPFQFSKDKWMCTECPWVFSSCVPNAIPLASPTAAPQPAALPPQGAPTQPPTSSPAVSIPVASAQPDTPPQSPPPTNVVSGPLPAVACGRGCIVTLGNRSQDTFCAVDAFSNLTGGTVWAVISALQKLGLAVAIFGVAIMAAALLGAYFLGRKALR